MAFRGFIGFLAGWATWRYWWFPSFGGAFPDNCLADWSRCYFGWILAFSVIIALLTVLLGHE